MVDGGLTLEQVLADYADKFKVLSDPQRLKILLFLRDGEKCVCEIMEMLQLKQSRVSYHLKLMVDTGILQRRKKGTWNYYRLNPELGKWFKNCCEWITADDIINASMTREQHTICQKNCGGLG